MAIAWQNPWETFFPKESPGIGLYRVAFVQYDGDMLSIYDFILDVNAKTDALLKRIGAHLKVDRVSVYQFLDDRQILRHLWPHPDAAEDHFCSLMIDLPDIYFRLKSFVPFFEPLDGLPPLQGKALQDKGVQSAIFLPIQYKGDLWGFLCCAMEKKTRLWKSEELSHLLREALEITQNIILGEILGEIKDSDDTLHYMLEEITEGITTVDANGNITSIAGHIAQLGGYAQEELLGHAIKEFIYKDDWATLDQHLEKVKQGERRIDNYRLVMKSGDLFWTRITTTPIIKHGIHKGFICLIYNLSRMMAVENRLKEHQDMLDCVSDLVWMTDMNLWFTYVSPSVEYLLGYTAEEALRLNSGLTLAEESLQRLATAFSEGLRAADRGDRAWKTVLPVEQFHRDGRRLNGELLLVLRRNNEGEAVGFIGVTHFALQRAFPQ